ncbi:hypothetical protein ACT4UT_15880, partial [Bacillus sp. B-TM1]
MKQSKEEFIKSEGADFPGKTYVDCVLQHVYHFYFYQYAYYLQNRISLLEKLNVPLKKRDLHAALYRAIAL